jgi:hypothetical protein
MTIPSLSGHGAQFRKVLDRAKSGLNVAVKTTRSRLNGVRKASAKKAYLLKKESQVKLGRASPGATLIYNIAAGKKLASKIIDELQSSKVNPGRVKTLMKKLEKLSGTNNLTDKFPITSLKNAELATHGITPQQIDKFGNQLKDVEKDKLVASYAANDAVSALWGEEGDASRPADFDNQLAEKTQYVDTLVSWLKTALAGG